MSIADRQIPWTLSLTRSNSMDIYDPIGTALGLTPLHFKPVFVPCKEIIGLSGFAGKRHTEETKALISAANKGKLSGENNPSKRPEIKAKLALPRKKRGSKPKTKPLGVKGRTYEEIYGPEKAAELKAKRAASKQGSKAVNYKPPTKVICLHCNKLYDPGNLKRHLTRLSIQAVDVSSNYALMICQDGNSFGS